LTASLSITLGWSVGQITQKEFGSFSILISLQYQMHCQQQQHLALVQAELGFNQVL